MLLNLTRAEAEMIYLASPLPGTDREVIASVERKLYQLLKPRPREPLAGQRDIFGGEA
jgi:hypothetical protein